MAGLFVAFEGGEGAGKSTQVALLNTELLDVGLQVTVTREPGGTPMGEQLRALLLSTAAGALTPRAEALLFAADRAHHVDTVIRPALDAGHVVLTDRFADSSIAYQGHGRNLGPPSIAWLSRWATGNLQPDLVVVLDIDPERGLQRLKTRDRIESEALRFHTNARFGFLQRARQDPERYLVVDATQPPDFIAAMVADRVLPLTEGMPG